MGTYREYGFNIREEDASAFELKIIDLALASLKEKGILKRIGPAKGGHWEIVEGND